MNTEDLSKWVEKCTELIMVLENNQNLLKKMCANLNERSENVTMWCNDLDKRLEMIEELVHKEVKNE